MVYEPVSTSSAKVESRSSSESTNGLTPGLSKVTSGYGSGPPGGVARGGSRPLPESAKASAGDEHQPDSQHPDPAQYPHGVLPLDEAGAVRRARLALPREAAPGVQVCTTPVGERFHISVSIGTDWTH